MLTPANRPNSQQLSQLLWQHYRWYLRAGTGIWACTMLPLFSFSPLFPAYSINKNLFASFYERLEITLLFLVFCLLYPSVSGLVLHPLLTYMARVARTRTALVWQSMLLFELSIALLALTPWLVAYNQFSAEMVKTQFSVSVVLTLPWLLATGLASRRLAAALALHEGPK
ncbi:hypothetical protein [Hymenobacter glacialis]|nr:hypothetical protein [Hymenobacter glacialis]